MRGEYTQKIPLVVGAAELPPRARRIHPHAHFFGAEPGTTSACAENTSLDNLRPAHLGNYLRVRGEYDQRGLGATGVVELPPRARRILIVDINGVPHYGTTSACAENTAGDTSARSNNRNYLRVRGEYSWSVSDLTTLPELPPRARRIRKCFTQAVPNPGTTSACAENTRCHGFSLPRSGNYLRVRGEYP